MFAELAYTRRGTGEPLVLIHGIGHRRQAFDPVVDRLAEHFDVIAVDLSGFGESPGHPDGVPYTMDNACSNLADNFERWGIERPHVVGNSLGGAIALELAARGLVSSVTALSPAGFFGRLNRLQTFALLVFLRLTSLLTPKVGLRLVSRTRWGRWLAGFSLYAHPQRFTPERVLGDALALKTCKGFEATLKQGLRYRFDSALPVPATIAWGTRDLILPYGSAGIAAERVQDAEHVALPECGHVPMSDDPALVVRVVENTIARTRLAEAA